MQSIGQKEVVTASSGTRAGSPDGHPYGTQTTVARTHLAAILIVPLFLGMLFVLPKASFGWLLGTQLAQWILRSQSIWAYPTILVLHTVGLAFLVGGNVVVDFRLLGLGKDVPLTSMRPLFRLMWIGFWVNASSGTLLFIADAEHKAAQWIFFLKLTCVAVAVAILVLIQRNVAEAAGVPEGEISGSSKTLALVSLFLWLGAISAGRLMAYVK